VTWSLNPILTFIAIRQRTPFFVLYRWDSSKIPKLYELGESWLLLDGFALNVKVSYDTTWIFHRFSGSSILVFRSRWVRFAFSGCNKLMSLKSVPYVISLMTLMNISTTLGVVTTKNGSKADVCAECPCGGVDWIFNRRRGTEFCLRNGYHFRLSPTIPGKLFCTRLTHSLNVFPHKMDCDNPITTCSVTNLQSIAAATEVKVIPRPISSATSVPDISVSQTHPLTMNHMAQSWCSRKLVPGRPGIEYLWPGTQSSVDWRIGWEFSSLTASSRHSCSNSWLIVLRIVLATGPGNLPAARVLTCGSVSFGPRPGQKPDLLCLGGFVTWTWHWTAGIWLGCNQTAVPNIRFLLLWLQWSIWVVIVSRHSQYVNCSALAPLSSPAFKCGIQQIFVECLWNNRWF